MPKPSTTTIERGRLVEALDTLADVARAIECAADDGRPLDDPDDLIACLRGVISDLFFEVQASDLLAGLERPDDASPGGPREEAP